MIEVKRKGVAVRLRPATLEGIQCLYVDVNSVTAALKDPEDLFRSMANFPGRAILVVDAWHETHLPLARHYLKLCRKWVVDCILSESKPAEALAAELACRDGCAVLSRDVDAVKAVGGCGVPVFLFLRGGFGLWSPMSCRRRRAVCIVLAAWPCDGCGAGRPAIRLDLADRHINVECDAYMFRVIAALLLAAAVLAAVDLSGLVDTVYNMSLLLERFTPTYVFEVDGCRVLVYMVDPTSENSPWATWIYNPAYYPRNKTLRPLTSAEMEKLLDALLQAFGSSVEAKVVVRTNLTLWHRELHLRVETRNATQLAEEARRAVEVDFYLGVADAYEALKKGAEQVAFLYEVKWRREDFVAVVYHLTSVSLYVETANFSATVEALKKARDAAGELWNSVEVMLWHGPYLIPDDAAKTLEKVAWMLGIEREWEFKDERGRARRVWGGVSVHFVGELGPVYVIFPRPSGVVPDKATVEQLVRNFVEQSGFCKSPLVVEFWPGIEIRSSSTESLPPLLPYVATVSAALAVAVGLLVLVRRRRWPALFYPGGRLFPRW